MKYILIIVLSFFVFSPAFAVRQIPGTVPNVQPLQPIPEGSHPNIQKSIQNQPEKAQDNLSDQPGAAVENQQTTGDNSASTKSPTGQRGTGSRIFLIASLIAAAVIIFLAMRKKNGT